MKVSNPIPCDKISHYVDRILVIEDALVTNPFTLPLYANGAPTLLFQTAKGIIKNNSNNLTLFGQTVFPETLTIRDNFMLIAYFFKPFALFALFGVSAQELTNNPIDLNLLAPSKTQQLQEQLLNAATTGEMIGLLDDYVFSLITKTTVDCQIIRFATLAIAQNAGKDALLKVQKELHVTERTFQRMFEKNIGIAPNIGWLGWKLVGNSSNKATSIDAVKRLDGYFDVVMGGLDYQAWHAWNFGPVYQTEIFNPANGAWSALASMSICRVYHSTALLLPDGRVLTAGGGAGGAGSSNHPDAQIYSPPYLFKGPRPVVSSAISTINHGTTFSINYTGDAIQKVSLISLGSVTHSYNMNQRLVPLSFTNAGSGLLTVTAPLNCNIAPPGYYMLFLVDNNGVPSVAKIVQVYDLANPPARKSVADSAQQQEIVVRDLKGLTIDTRKKLLSANDNLALYLTADNEKLVIASSGKVNSKNWNAKIMNNRSVTVLKQDLTRGQCKSGKGDLCDCPAITEIDISKLADGVYTVIVASDKQTRLTANFVKQMTRFIVYPNPAAREVSVKFNNAFSYSLPVKDYLSSIRNVERIRVFDNAGREVLDQAGCAGSAACKVDVSSLPAGFYVLKVYTKEETEEHKIIVAH